ncbi:hypothetical protein TMatcc_007089 [Talaromyces marneffei ATCC 18224]
MPIQELLLPCPSLPSTERESRDTRSLVSLFHTTPSFVNFRSLRSFAAHPLSCPSRKDFSPLEQTKHDRPVPDWPTQHKRQGHFDRTAPAGDLLDTRKIKSTSFLTLYHLSIVSSTKPRLVWFPLTRRPLNQSVDIHRRQIASINPITLVLGETNRRPYLSIAISRLGRVSRPSEY